MGNQRVSEHMKKACISGARSSRGLAEGRGQEEDAAGNVVGERPGKSP